MSSGITKIWFVLLAFFFLNGIVYAQKADSIRIAKAFNNALSTPDNKDAFLKEASDINEKSKSPTTKDNYHYLQARYFFFTGQLDQAEKTVNQQLEVLGPRSEKSAKYFNILGTISTMRQDFKKAIELFQKTIAIYDERGDKKAAGLVRSNVGNIFFSLSDYESAYKYLYRAHEDVKSSSDSTNLPTIVGILSISEARTGRHKPAVIHARKVLSISKKHGNIRGESLAYFALGIVAISDSNTLEAIQRFNQTDSTATLVNDRNLMHLAHVELLSAYTDIRDFQKGKEVGEKALAELEVAPNQTTEYVIRKNLSEVYAGLGFYEKAYRFGYESDSIYKETSGLKNKEYISDLLIKYETAQKENQLKIERKENVIKQAQLNKQAWFLFALGLLLLIALLILWMYRSNQKSRLSRLKSEQENAVMRALIDGEEKERERVANELHDGLASDITGIKLVLQQNQSALPDGIFDALTRVQEQTRRISHNLSPLHLERLGVVGALRVFSQENSTEKTKIQVFATPANLKITSIEKSVVIYRMVQELVQNALKHADASEVNVQLLQNKEELSISVEDNGAGFDHAAVENSFGLLNIEKQVRLLKGELSIDSRLGNGTVVFLSLSSL